MALNATTGEMIAVKRFEILQMESDREDQRQVSVVEALKLESETLKDLDHPNIVQYLGYQETTKFLSMWVVCVAAVGLNADLMCSFLEYVPGGSVSSCIRKHGAFGENVTKSFTAQILDGLEYLHEKGILHRVRECDPQSTFRSYKLTANMSGHKSGQHFCRNHRRLQDLRLRHVEAYGRGQRIPLYSDGRVCLLDGTGGCSGRQDRLHVQI
jgi:hypothetical protein